MRTNCKLIKYRKYCRHCGKPVHQNPLVSIGYCRSCVNEIMRKWNNVPFIDRVKVLDLLGVKWGD